MVEPTNITRRPQGDQLLIRQPSLTFDELRLASVLANHKTKQSRLPLLALIDTLVYASDDATLSGTIADMVIQLDRIAASMGIDLSAAIRARFEPPTPRPLGETNEVLPR